MAKIVFTFLTLLIAGCAASVPDKNTSYDISYISEGIHERTDYTLKQIKDTNDANFPQSVCEKAIILV